MWQWSSSKKNLAVAVVLFLLVLCLYFLSYFIHLNFASKFIDLTAWRNQTDIDPNNEDVSFRANRSNDVSSGTNPAKCVFPQAIGKGEEDGLPMPPISKYRQRFLMWYQLRPDIAASIGPHVGDNSSRYLIYRCDAGRMSYCGGWADRVKGMIAGYILANLTGRIFKIEHLNPDCGVDRYLLPNVVNWSLPVPFHPVLHNGDANTGRVTWVGKSYFLTRLKTEDVEKLIGPQKYVYFKANLDYTRSFQVAKRYENQLSWMKSLTPAQIMATIYKLLFVLHPRLQTRLQDFLARALPTPQHRLICAHIRMGANPTIPKDAQVITSPKSLPSVWKFLSGNSKTDLDKVFIMTDSESTLQEAQRQSFAHRMVLTPGPVAHVERSVGVPRDKMCDAMEKVIFDQHVLMNCDVMLGSNSGLSRMAAHVRATARGQFCLRKKGPIVPCSPDNI